MRARGVLRDFLRAFCCWPLRLLTLLMVRIVLSGSVLTVGLLSVVYSRRVWLKWTRSSVGGAPAVVVRRCSPWRSFEVASRRPWVPNDASTSPSTRASRLENNMSVSHSFTADWNRVRRIPGYGATITVILNNEGLHAAEPHAKATLAWSAFTSVVHFPDGILLMRGNVGRWLPDSALQDAAPDAALTFERSKAEILDLVKLQSGASFEVR